MSEARLRRACSADIPATSENVLFDPARVTLQMYEDYLDRDERGWVTEVDGKIGAFCYADRNRASIWALFVDPQHEGQGHGKALLALAVAWLFELGHERIRLGTLPGGISIVLLRSHSDENHIHFTRNRLVDSCTCLGFDHHSRSGHESRHRVWHHRWLVYLLDSPHRTGIGATGPSQLVSRPGLT